MTKTIGPIALFLSNNNPEMYSVFQVACPESLFVQVTTAEVGFIQQWLLVQTRTFCLKYTVYHNDNTMV